MKKNNILKSNFKSAFSLIEISIVIIIIGVLIGGVSSGIGLLKKAKIATAQNLTTQSPVNSISDLVAWYETTLDSSFTDGESIEDGAKITSWNNISTQQLVGIHATQSNSSNQPTYKTKIQNGLPMIYFNGTSNYLEASYDPNFNPSKITIFVVVQATASTSTHSVFAANGTNSGYSFDLVSGSGYNLWIGNGSSSNRSTSANANVNNSVILSASNDGSTSAIYKNGTALTTTSANYSSNNSKPFRIGAGKSESVTPDYYFSGYIGEIIIYGHLLKTEDRKSVEKYLSQKWGITLES